MESFNEWQEMMEMIQCIMCDESYMEYAKEYVEYILKHYTVYNSCNYLYASYMAYQQEVEEVLNVIHDNLYTEVDEIIKKEIEEEDEEEEEEEEEEVDLKRTLVDEDTLSEPLRIRADVVITADGDEGYMTGSLNPNGCYGDSVESVFIPKYILDIASNYQDVRVGSILTLSIQFKREDEVRMPWSAYYYNTKEEPETRFDPTVINSEGDCVESNAFTFDEFVAYYGDEADELWNESENNIYIKRYNCMVDNLQ
tara:strand:+ start:8792 stop:9553 length:762 start_codon:yes stop_codon:yes gene_type:complete